MIPDTVLKGVKKQGPTVKQLQEEFGGAGNFYIPPEEHYLLDKEEWRYDQFPEFYNGSNVLDFYDPDIERKLAALEREEEEILKMELAQNKLMGGEDSEEENSDGVREDDLKAALAEVRSKKAIFKQRHKLKGKLVHRDKKAKVEDMIDHFESIGVDVNKESLRSRSKSRRRIGDLESAQDKKAAAMLDSSDEDGEAPIDDPELAAKEAETRGRKRRRERSVNPDDYMDIDEEKDSIAGHKKRNLTPAQRTVSAQKIIRSKTKERREGSEPKRLPYKLVPEEQIRLAKKIVKKFKHQINVNEADRHIATSRPKHLFAGKMSNGTRSSR